MKLILLLMVLVASLADARAAAASSWPFWDHYAAHFVTAEGRVVDPDRDSMTTSEGQGYAMFFALVAGDAASFERLRLWTEENLAQGDLSKTLPAWSWGRNGAAWGVLDRNSASDADLWIAYSLIQAGKLWLNPGYSRTGKGLLSEIAKEEVATLPQIGPVLLPGREGFHSDADRWTLNPSYLPLPLLMAAAGVAPDGPWKQMALGLPNWLRQASPAGFAMDWVEYVQGKGLFPAGAPADPASAPRGSYDAIRVYLWAGVTDPGTSGAGALLDIFAPMSRLMKDSTVPPESVDAGGNASNVTAPAGFSAALMPFLLSTGETAAASRLRRQLDLCFDTATGLLGSPARYYDQNLALFAFGWQERRFRFAPDGTLRMQWRR
jgi:endo-1,4-beta-D-glucanase Y